MQLGNYYYYFKNALSNKFCDDVIKYGNSLKEKIAITGNFEEDKNLTKKELKDLKKQRNSNVSWINEPWVYREIYPYIHAANKEANWNFQWDASEDCQFTKYKLNQFYDWHCDSHKKTYDNPDNLRIHGKIRKLSVTCSLSAPEDYKGGELEFDFRQNESKKTSTTVTCKEILPRGSIVVFPSFVWHRVKPVIKGTRYSLVIWNLGKPFI